MNEYWQQQHGLTPDEKRAFVERTLTDEARFRQSLRKITDSADNRMRERTAKQQHRDALRELNRGPDDVIDDADDSSLQRGVLK
jgi:hypothetical protein